MKSIKFRGILWSILAVLTVAMLSVGFASCGDDDDEPSGSVVGTWTGTNGTWNFTYVFNSNGTGSADGTSKRGSKHIWTFTWSGKSTIKCSGPHTYVGFDGEVTNEPWDFTLKLNGNTLTGANFGITLTKQ